MRKNIILASSALLLSSIFFVINDAIINYLSSNDIQFYHFIFYGTPAYLIVPIYLFFTKKLKQHLVSSNYKILIIRSLIFSPMPFITFLALKNISLPQFTTLNMSSPLVGAILAFFILKEKLNFYIYTSLLFGFTGVLFVVQPGFDTFNIYFLVTLLGVFFITLSTVIVNKYNNIDNITTGGQTFDFLIPKVCTDAPAPSRNFCPTFFIENLFVFSQRLSGLFWRYFFQM